MAPPQSASPQSVALLGTHDPALHLNAISGLHISELWRAADGDSVGLSEDELATVLVKIGAKYNYGFAQATVATREQVEAFYLSLQLQDLALAHACVLGRDAAWTIFIARYREPLTQAAIGIARSPSVGQDLADSLYAELFGLTERGELRLSPLDYYSGRGSLKGFLRTTLAQRHVDHHRRFHREAAIPHHDLQAPPPVSTPESSVLAHLQEALSITLGSLASEERFLLSAWFLDRRTLLDISRLLQVHEATVSRRLQRLTTRLHADLLKSLQRFGLSKSAAEEALETDPRDLDINLRTLLQASQKAAFPEQEGSTDAERK